MRCVVYFFFIFLVSRSVSSLLEEEFHPASEQSPPIWRPVDGTKSFDLNYDPPDSHLEYDSTQVALANFHPSERFQFQQLSWLHTIPRHYLYVEELFLAPSQATDQMSAPGEISLVSSLQNPTQCCPKLPA